MFTVILMVIFLTIRVSINSPTLPGFSEFIKSLLFSILLGISYIVYNIYWGKSFTFSISENELSLKGGILRKSDVVSSFDKITDIIIYQDLFGKWFNYATVYLRREQSFAEVSFFGVDYNDALKIRDLINTKINKSSDFG